MADPTLIDRITTKIQNGEKRAKIKQDLMIEGWPEGDIDMAYSHIHKEALKQIPYVEKFLNHLHELEAKTASLPPSTLVGILAACAVGLLILAVGMYMVLDPLNAQASARDKERAAVFKQTNQALGQYFNDKSLYPVSVDELVPDYLSAVPVDPYTKKPFDYKLVGEGNYQLCVTFELQSVACVVSENAQVNELPVQVDETASPAAVPTVVTTLVPTRTSTSSAR